MKIVIYWLLWTGVCGGASWLLWKGIKQHLKVYLLIGMNWIFLSGTFLIYALSKRIPLW